MILFLIIRVNHSLHVFWNLYSPKIKSDSFLVDVANKSVGEPRYICVIFCYILYFLLIYLTSVTIFIVRRYGSFSIRWKSYRLFKKCNFTSNSIDFSLMKLWFSLKDFDWHKSRSSWLFLYQKIALFLLCSYRKIRVHVWKTYKSKFINDIYQPFNSYQSQKWYQSLIKSSILSFVLLSFTTILYYFKLF